MITPVAQLLIDIEMIGRYCDIFADKTRTKMKIRKIFGLSLCIVLTALTWVVHRIVTSCCYCSKASKKKEITLLRGNNSFPDLNDNSHCFSIWRDTKQKMKLAQLLKLSGFSSPWCQLLTYTQFLFIVCKLKMNSEETIV